MMGPLQSAPARAMLAVLALLLWSVHAQAETTITSLTANPTSVAPGETVTLGVTIQTEAVEILTGDATLSLLRDGMVVSEQVFPGYLDQADLGTGTLEDSIPLSPDLYSTPGNYTVELTISGLEDAQVPVSDTATTGFVVEEPVVPVSVQPAALQLEGMPGETVSGSFTVTEGNGPFALAASLGSVSPARSDVGQAVAYEFVISGTAQPGTEISDVIQVTPTAGEPANVPVTITVAAPSVVPVVVEPAALQLEGTPGETVSGSFTVTAGNAPFALAASLGSVSPASADVGQAVAYEFVIPGTAQPGTQISDVIEVTPAAGEPASVPVTVNVTAPPAEPIVLQPGSLSLVGGAGDTPTATFTITSGVAPFTLSSANDEGRGSFSNTSPALDEVVTYGFRIPGAATDQQQITDVVTVEGADGSVTTIVATITVNVADAPTQGEIDEAMQDIARTPPQRATAAVIGTVCPAGVVEPRLQEDCNVLVGAALQEDGSAVQLEAAQALAQVTPDQVSAPVNASQTGMLSQLRNVGSRIAALRGGATGFSAQGLSLQLDGRTFRAGDVADALLQELMASHGGAAGDTLGSTPWGVFVNGRISAGDKDDTENVAGFDYDEWAITVGADYRFSDHFVAGAAFGYSNNETDVDANGGSLDTDGYSLSLYGMYSLDSGLYLDGIVTYGWSDYDQQRNIRYGIGGVSVQQTARSDFDGSQWSAAVGGGHSFSRGALTFGPTVRLEYVDTEVDGFQERMSRPTADGGGWATRIEGQDVTSLTSQIGGELSYAMSMPWGVLLPSAQVEWVHEFEDGGENVVGHFVQDTSRTRFSLDTDDFDRNYYNVQLGVSAQLAEGRSGFLYYRKLLGYDDLDAYTIGAGLRLEF